MTRTGFARVAHGRGTLAVWSFIALALMPLACAEQTNNSDANTPVAVTAGGVEIVSLERDETRRTVEATVSNHGVERHVTLVPLVDGPSPGLQATIASDGGTFFEVSIAYDERTRELWVRERTAVDEMTLTMREHEGRVFETYEINGARLEFDRPAMTAAQLDKAIARYRSGEIASAATPELREVGEKLAVFDAFYTPTMSNTLHHNSDGELLMALIADPTVAGLVTGEDVTPQRADGSVQRLCYAASLCMAWKCKLGGITNPVCVACVGTYVTCVIAEIICWFAGCDCCF